MKKILIGCLGGLALIVVIVSVVLWFWLFRELPVLEAKLSVPPEVSIGSTVSLFITATNPHTKTVTLDSIDVDDAFLTGFQVVTITPEPTDTMHVPFTNQRSWSFAKPVEPGDSITVSFVLKPVIEGHFSGDIDVCNPNQDFTTLLADMVITGTLSQQAMSNNRQ